MRKKCVGATVLTKYNCGVAKYEFNLQSTSDMLESNCGCIQLSENRISFQRTQTRKFFTDGCPRLITPGLLSSHCALCRKFHDNSAMTQHDINSQFYINKLMKCNSHFYCFTTYLKRQFKSVYKMIIKQFFFYICGTLGADQLDVKWLLSLVDIFNRSCQSSFEYSQV